MAAVVLRIRTDLTGLVEGGGLSTHYFDADDDPEIGPLLNAVGAFWVVLRPRITSQVTYQVRDEVDYIDTATGTLLRSDAASAPVGNSGGAAGAPLPPSVQGLLRLRTPLIVGGRRLQGRLFLPGFVSGSEGGDTVPGTGLLAAMESAGTGLITTAQAAGSSWQVWSRTGGVSSPVSAVSAWSKYAVLRSRRD